MSEAVILTGMVLFAAPSSEYDRRIILLTKERGKITAFARGARRPGNALMGAAVPFCLGRFRLFEGRSAYTLVSAQIDYFFSDLRTDLEGSAYGSYFMELAGYYGRENLDASMMLNLLYVSLKALENKNLSNRLVRCVFEIRMMVINGEFPTDLAADPSLSETARSMIAFVTASPLKKLYTFTVTQPVLEEVEKVLSRIRNMTLDRHMKSLDVLEALGDYQDLMKHPPTEENETALQGKIETV